MRLLITALLACSVSAMLVMPSWGQRPGRPSAAASIEVITRTINDCEDRTDRFVKTLRRALNDSSLNGSSREDDLNRSARELEKSMDRVGKSWNREKDIAKTRRHVRDAIGDAKNINITMRNRRLRPEAEEQWRAVRLQINLLARAFSLPTVSW